MFIYVVVLHIVRSALGQCSLSCVYFRVLAYCCIYKLFDFIVLSVQVAAFIVHVLLCNIRDLVRVLNQCPDLFVTDCYGWDYRYSIYSILLAFLGITLSKITMLLLHCTTVTVRNFTNLYNCHILFDLPDAAKFPYYTVHLARLQNTCALAIMVFAFVHYIWVFNCVKVYEIHSFKLLIQFHKIFVLT